jgi:hypothetical protein
VLEPAEGRPGPAAAPSENDDLVLDRPTIKHGYRRLIGEPVARREKKVMICVYAGLTRLRGKEKDAKSGFTKYNAGAR